MQVISDCVATIFDSLIAPVVSDLTVTIPYPTESVSTGEGDPYYCEKVLVVNTTAGLPVVSNYSEPVLSVEFEGTYLY